MATADTGSDSNSQYDTDEEKQAVPNKKKKFTYKQKFSDKWLSAPEFKPWLTKKSINGQDFPFCDACKVKISCARTAIKRHGDSKSHENVLKMVANLKKSQPSIRSVFESSSHDVAKMEIKICSFITEHNLPISICESFVPFLRSIFPSDSVVKNVKLGKQKATNTIRQVLGFHYMKENVQLLQEHKFSLIIDETTDRATISQLALLGVYFDKEKFQLVNVFIGLIELSDGKAHTIYNKVKECLSEMHIPMENIIGFCADTCNVMFGKHNSVSQLLVKECPWIVLVKCSCHLIHLCSSYASMMLPKSLEDLCRNIYAHFHMSSKKTKAFHEFQDFFDIERHNILKAGHTRWLSMKTCVDRILEQYEPLKLYFTQVSLEDPTHTNESIMRSLNNKFTQAYLEFLSFNLGRLTSFNTLFQSSVPLLHQLRKEVTKLTNAICSDFMDIGYLMGKDLEKIDLNNEVNFVPLNKTYVGIAAFSTIQSIVSDVGDDHEDVKVFYSQCQSFLRECIKQIRSRFDNINSFDFLSCLSPEVAKALTLPTLTPVFSKLPYLKDVVDAQQADLEWRQLPLCSDVSNTMDVKVFWQSVFSAKNAVGSPTFPHLTKLVTVLFSFPFSNAAVERLFSQLKLIKNDHRAALKNESLLGLVSTKLAFQQKGKDYAVTLDPSKPMIRLHARMTANADDEEVAKLRKDFLRNMGEEKDK